MLKKKSQKTVKIKSRNVVETDTTSLCLLKKPTYRQHFRGRRRFNCAIMRKKLTPIFRQISDVATPKSVKKMAEMTVCAASQRLSKAYSGGFVGEVSAAETSYFVSSCCLQRSSDTSLHLPSQFKQCKWCLAWPCPARPSKHLRLIVVYLPGERLFLLSLGPNDVVFPRSFFPKRKS